MGFIAWIVIGIVAGFLAEKILKRDDSLIMNLIIGIAGAFVGGGILRFFGLGGTNGLIMSIVTATFGAIVLLWVVGLIKKTASK